MAVLVPRVGILNGMHRQRARVRRLVRSGLVRSAHQLPPPLRERTVALATRLRLHRRPDGLLVPRAALEQLYRDLLRIVHEPGQQPGAYLEFGVFAGDSLVAMARAADAEGWPELSLVGFDSFEGLPASVEGPGDDQVWYEHQFSCPRTVTEWNLRRHGVDPARVELIPGWYDETLTTELAQSIVERLDRAGVVMVDCDAYVSAVPVLDFVTPLLGRRTAIVLDDWYSFNDDEGGRGVQRAFERWLAAHPDLVAEPLPGDRHPDYPGKVFLVERTGSRSAPKAAS